MTKYDAFGREVGEDPLEALRGDALPRGAGAEPVPAMTPATGPDASGHDTARQDASAHDATGRRRRPAVRVRRVFALLVTLGVVGAIVVPFTVGVVDSVVDAIDETEDVTRIVEDAVREGEGARGQAGEEAGRDAEPAGPPRGVQRGSLLTRAELAPALRRLRGLGALVNIAIRPERINAQLLTRQPALRIVQVLPGARPDVQATSPGARPGMTRIPFSELDARAPFRLTRSAAGRLRVPTTRVDYVVALKPAGQPVSWVVYFKESGGIFQGDARGRVVRRIS